MLAKSDGREAEEQRWAKEMWFKRSGELLQELSTERQTSAAATAAAAAAKAEAAMARSEVAAARSEVKAAEAKAELLAQKCELLERSLTETQERTAIAAVHNPTAQMDMAETEALPSREQLVAWQEAASEGRKRAEEDAARQRKRANALRTQVDQLSVALEQREREAHDTETDALAAAHRGELQTELQTLRERQAGDAAELAALRARCSHDARELASLRARLEQQRAQHDEDLAALRSQGERERADARAVISLRSQLEQREREVHEMAELLNAVRSCSQLELPAGHAAGGASVESVSKPSSTSQIVAASPPPPNTDVALPAASEFAALASELTTLVRDSVRGALGGEMRKLVDELRNTAVAKAEAACDMRIATLEVAVGELLGALDAETHRLLTKWRGRLDTAERENRRLKEELRLHHVAALDLKGQLKKQHLAGGSVSLHGQLAAASEAAAAKQPQQQPQYLPPPPPPPPQQVQHQQHQQQYQHVADVRYAGAPLSQQPNFAPMADPKTGAWTGAYCAVPTGPTRW